MIPQHLRAKLEEKIDAEEFYQWQKAGHFAEAFTSAEMKNACLRVAESLYALLSETTPDDEKDAEEYAELEFSHIKNGQKHFSAPSPYHLETGHLKIAAFLAGRSGTVPKAHVDRLVKEAVEEVEGLLFMAHAYALRAQKAGCTSTEYWISEYLKLGIEEKRKETINPPTDKEEQEG